MQGPGPRGRGFAFAGSTFALRGMLGVTCMNRGNKRP